MRLSSKQRNVISYNFRNLYGYLTSEEVDGLLSLCESDLLRPADISIIVGNVWDMQKDEREGVSEEKKRFKANEIRKIMEDYITKTAA